MNAPLRLGLAMLTALSVQAGAATKSTTAKGHTEVACEGKSSESRHTNAQMRKSKINRFLAQSNVAPKVKASRAAKAVSEKRK